ncbi:E3 ubiquitin-protein ligase RNF123 [Patella vulgata]|uniref:E3 ubiquitin-protein ligase RNF123 n=1 Tax=Patella vulgata TaxID=6465 RepID=UPI0024A93301|nr:E3 ubiquitin-protein ligase RNF123 [Patella vulgata]
MLKVLLIHNDLMEKNETSRVIFLEKFRAFLRENSGLGRVHQTHSCPLPVSLCFFHRLVQAVRYYWDNFRLEDPCRFVLSKDAFMPVQEFWSDSRDYFDFQRCGGLMSHLNRTLGGEVNKAQGLVVYDDGKDIKVKTVPQTPGEEYPDTELPSGNSLIDLLDGLVILYHSTAHKQLGKMCALRDNMKDFVLALQDTEEKYNKCPEEMKDVRDDLLKAKEVFLEKITEQARQMGWVLAVIYSKPKQEDVCWILNVVLKTIEKASHFRRLLQFMPEFYIETCVNAYNALKNYIHPTTPFESLPGYEDILRRYAMFLTNHFADQKIVSNDLRDSLVQALACFTCYANTLHILETLPMENREKMIRALIAPYENRSWAHTNWILVRLWKGCGFGYRYRYLPNLVPSKVQPTEFSFVSLQKPCPSQILQSLLAKILLDDEPTSTRFLDTLMNQLNWSFSEFVGIMQEIQQLVSRTEQLFIESRQLKICAACFEISVCLLRVLEMVVTIAPDLFTDYCRSSAELFLKRIMQLLSQVLSRITTKNGAFENLSPLPIPGLDSVTYFPILTVTVGILVQLIGRSGGTSQERATRALLTDAGFMIKSLEFVFTVEERSSTSKFNKPFSFKNFEEIGSEEIQDVENLIIYLKKQQIIMSKQAQDIKEDDLCTICYANLRTAVFVPCSHQSCRTCITQQLMTKKECFFCKAVITSVTDLKNRPILREHFLPPKKT